MILLYNQPTLSDIQALTKRISHFPFSVKQLIQLARQEHFPESVIRFYKTFPPDEIFEDAEDLMARTEQVELMHHAEQDQPSEPYFDEP